MPILLLIFFSIYNSTYVYGGDKDDFLASYVLEVSPGYSSSYLALDKGDIVNRKTNNISLIEKFDLARTKILGRSSQEKFYDFFKTEFYSHDALPWEGKCDQWSCAATDPFIEDLLKKDKNLYCKDLYFSKGELRELFSAFYPVIHQDNIEFGLPSFSLGVDTASDNALYSILDSLGFAHLPAHTFLKILYKGLSQGKRVVCNVDSRGEIWNQPVYLANNHSKIISNKESQFFPAFTSIDFNSEQNDNRTEHPYVYNVISNSLKNYKGFSFFFEGEGPKIQQNLLKLEEIDLALMKLFLAGIYPNTDPFFILKDYKIENHPFPSFSEEILNLTQDSTHSAINFVSLLIKTKEEIFQESLSLGLKLKSKFIMYEIKSEITYSDELEFAEDFFYKEGKQMAYDYPHQLIPYNKASYSFYIVKNQETGELYSRWKDKNLGAKTRPGAISIAESSSQIALAEAPHYLKDLPSLIHSYLSLSQYDQSLDSLKANGAYAKILMVGLFDLISLYEKCSK